jgi:hypothetical protein
MLGCAKEDGVVLGDAPLLEFPELVPQDGLPAGYEWEFNDGPDFYVYRSENEDGRTGVGMYFGMHPNFEEKENVKKEVGYIAGKKVEWSIDSSQEVGTPRHFRQTVFKYKHSKEYYEIQIHTWIYSDELEEVLDFQKNLRDLKYKVISYEERMRQSEPVAGGDATR